MNTIAELFHKIEESGLRWAVLRNYENLPNLEVTDTQSTDLDLVVHHDDVARLRTILMDVAGTCGWDALTECDHYTQSSVRHHNIEVFRFYRADPLEFLQVDVFHAYIVCGLPLLDEAEMLEGRRFDARRSLSRIDPVKENVYRLVQIEAVLHSRSKAAKRERYVRRLKAFRWQHPEEFSKSLQSCFSPFAAAAAKSLCQGNARAFSLHMRLARVHFVVREALRAPLRTIRQALVRRAENRLRFYTRPCGTVLKVWAFGTDERAALVEALNALTRKNAVDEWSELAASERSLTEDRLSVLEQGGILIRWTAAGEADMLLEQGAGSARITRELLAMLVRRHRILQGSEQAVGPVEAVSA